MSEDVHEIVNFFKEKFNIKNFKLVSEDSFTCNNQKNLFNVEWVLKKPYTYQKIIKDELYQEIFFLKEYNKICENQTYIGHFNTEDCQGPQ